jgi:hypothetical protein
MKRIALWLMVIAWGFYCQKSMAEDGTQDKLRVLRNEVLKASVSIQRLESEYLALVAIAGSDVERGAIYSELVRASSKKDGGYEILVRYSKKALALPIGPEDRCSIYETWATALKSTFRKTTETTDELMEIAILYAKGILAASEQVGTNSIQQLPPVGKYRYVGTGQEAEQARSDQQQRERDFRTNVRRNNALVRYRIFFIEEYAELCAREARAAEKCDMLAQAYLAKYPAVLDELRVRLAAAKKRRE